jgi:hypothetical protein
VSLDTRRVPSSPHRPISPQAAWTSHRTAAALLAAWIGCIFMAAISAPLSFRAVDSLMGSPPELLATALKNLGPVTVYEVLRLMAGEANRLLFQTVGWLQIGFAAAVFLLVVFFTNLRKSGVILASLLLAGSLAIGLALIPAIAEAGRVIQASAAARAGGADRFRALHLAFTAFEGTLVVLSLLLLVELLRRSRLSSRSSGST